MKKLLFISLLLTSQMLTGQYFGQNKPQYERIDFDVYQTTHFDIYNYMENPAFLQLIAENAEQWYILHQSILKDTFDLRNPIILYNNHPDFQQTRTISSRIGEGTGGVTESLKNRVVFPFLFSNQQTGHVLGHELVHAFQYHLIKKFNREEAERKKKAKDEWLKGQKEKQEIKKGERKTKKEERKRKKSASDSIGSKNVPRRLVPPDTAVHLISFQNLPLWMVEGMAEYLSIGRKDPHTAMWIRDAIQQDDIPSLKQMSDYSKYFPYRWGQTFWAFIVGNFGEDVMLKLFIETGQFGLDKALMKNFGMKEKEFSVVWIKHLKDYYGTAYKEYHLDTIGHEWIVGKGKGGRVNVGPSISPNGQYLVYASEKDIFSIDLYLADAKSGEVLRKLTSVNRSLFVDAVGSIETSVTWSPDNSHIAFLAISGGRNQLVILDIYSPRKVEQYILKDVPAFTTPSWSPNGEEILVTGLVDGQIDLYSFNIQTKETSPVTNDPYSEILPSWTPDGKILYSSDRSSFEAGKTLGNLNYHIELLDPKTGIWEAITTYEAGDQMNAVSDGNGIWFISDHDGFKNLHYYDFETETVTQRTKIWTGISGITHYAPALTISRGGDLIYTLYSDNEYELYRTTTEYLRSRTFKEDSVVSTRFHVLPSDTADIITMKINNLETIVPDSTESFDSREYSPDFKIDYIGGSTGIGIANGPLGNTAGMVGGVNLFMSDILGYNSMFFGAALNGQLADFNIQTAYINQQGRLPWGVSYSHFTYVTGLIRYLGEEPIQIGDVTAISYHYALDQYRTSLDQINAAIYYPINLYNRFELSGSLAYYYYSFKRYHVYYLGTMTYKSKEEKLPSPDGFFVQNVSLAYVHDHSRFGMTAPSVGSRYRIEVGKYFGEFHFHNVLVDYRKYVFIKPFTLAMRVMHYGRYGNSDMLYPLYLGNPGYIRGYSFGRLVDDFQVNPNFSIDALIGTKVALASVEIRFPLTGPERLAWIPSKFWFSDIAIFFDAGMAWNDWDNFQLTGPENNQITQQDRPPLLIGSIGVSYRINVGGAFVIEPYYAVPTIREFKRGLGVNIIPGW